MLWNCLPARSLLPSQSTSPRVAALCSLSDDDDKVLLEALLREALLRVVVCQGQSNTKRDVLVVGNGLLHMANRRELRKDAFPSGIGS